MAAGCSRLWSLRSLTCHSWMSLAPNYHSDFATVTAQNLLQRRPRGRRKYDQRTAKRCQLAAVTVPGVLLVEVPAQQCSTDTTCDRAKRATANGVPSQRAARTTGHGTNSHVAAATAIALVIVGVLATVRVMAGKRRTWQNDRSEAKVSIATIASSLRV